MSKYNYGLNLTLNSTDSLILDRIRPNTTVLEFGPAHGRMTQYLKEQKSCKMYCVELDATAADSCQPFCEEILVSNIETFDWLKNFGNIQFDHIIFADVLEHLYDPWEVLRRCHILLKLTGSVIISLPNISHNAIILDLMQDKFEYSPTGLLDNTHIRFFTKHSIDRMVHDTGYAAVFESAFYLDALFTEFQQTTAYELDSIASYLGQRAYGNVYQFIYEIQKKEFVNSSNKILEPHFAETYLCELFLDSGQEFREEEVVRTNTTGKGNLKIQSDVPIKGLRLDPIDRPCSIYIRSISLELNGKPHSLDIQKVNSSFVDNSGNYFFYHSDPQIFISIPYEFTDGELFFDLDITLLQPSSRLFDAMQSQYQTELSKTQTELSKTQIELSKTQIELSKTQTELSKTQTELSKAQTELSKTQTELSNIQVILQKTQISLTQLEQDLSNVFSSKSWKITKPLRWIVKIFKRIRFFRS